MVDFSASQPLSIFCNCDKDPFLLPEAVECTGQVQWMATKADICSLPATLPRWTADHEQIATASGVFRIKGSAWLA